MLRDAVGYHKLFPVLRERDEPFIARVLLDALVKCEVIFEALDLLSHHLVTDVEELIEVLGAGLICPHL